MRAGIILISILLTVWMLRMASAALIPLAMALLVIVLAWPLQRRLDRSLPRVLSVVITLLVIFLVLALLGGGVWVCVNNLSAESGVYQPRFEKLVEQGNDLLGRFQVSAGLQTDDVNQLVGRAMDFVGGVAKNMYEMFGILLLMFALVVLGLSEVSPFRRRLEPWLRRDGVRRLAEAADQAATGIQRFMLTRTLTSALTGLLTALFAWLIGLDFPIVWGFMAYVLNYIPVIGSVIAVIPPTLVAFVLPEPGWRVPLALSGLVVIQFTIGNYLDPLLQGRFLSLPPVVIFYAIVLWSWLWGIAGAFLAVPLTLSIIIVCRHFENTQWVADLLIRERREFNSLRSTKSGSA